MAASVFYPPESFQAGDAFSVGSALFAGVISNSARTQITFSIITPKYIPDSLTLSVAGCTVHGVRSGSGASVTPGGTLTWSVTRGGDHSLNVSFSGTSAASGATAFAAVVVHISCTVTFG